MKVVFNLPSIPKYQARFYMLKALARKVDFLTVVTAEYKGSDDALPENMRVECLPKDKMHFLGGILSSKAVSKADIVHDTFGYLMPAGLITRFWRSRKYVSSVYGSAGGWLRKAEEIGYGNLPEIKAQRKLLRREHLNALMLDHIFANSPDFIEDYATIHGYPREMMTVVPNSVIVKEGEEYLEKDGDGFELLYIGRLSKMKGIDLLLEAHQELVAKGLDVHLTAIGSTNAHDRIFIEGRDWRNVSFIGEKRFDEIIPFYRKADACIHPSIQEGMPRVIMEALSCGLPIIASSLPGIKTIDSSGKFIRVMKDFEKDTLAQLIIEEIARPRKSERFFHESREHMRGFSPERTASKIHDGYMKL